MKKIKNPPNPFSAAYREWLEPAPDAKLEVYEDQSRTVLSKNDSPDVAFRWSANPYRGCFHSCAYCYARRYHEFLDMGAGTDFESKIAVKRDAPALLRREFDRPKWTGEVVTFSGATDCYQPLEAVYRLTRGCLEVCRDYRNPVCVITKSYLVVRDVEILRDLARDAYAVVILSIPFASDDLARTIEPQAAPIARRFAALERLSRAGVPCGVSLAPTIPGLNDGDIPAILARAADAGARFAFHSMVRLSGSVQTVFEEKIRASLPPTRVERIINRIRDARAGKMNDDRFGHRMKGEGPYWESARRLFDVSRKKHGLNRPPAVPDPSPFRRPDPQLSLPLNVEPSGAVDR